MYYTLHLGGVMPPEQRAPLRQAFVAKVLGLALMLLILALWSVFVHGPRI